MHRDVFAARLNETAAIARRFGQTFVTETLPEATRFRVFLNQSAETELRPDEAGFPHERKGPLELNEGEVVDLLWREGSVPEWIDVSLCGANRDATILQVLVCGRFTANEGLLYHVREGRPPFHVTSPPLPPGYEDGDRFSVSTIRPWAALDRTGHASRPRRQT